MDDTPEIVSPFNVLLPVTIKGKKTYMYQGNALNEAQVKAIKSEAEIIEKLGIWKMLLNEGKYHAQKRATIDSKTGDDAKDLMTLREGQAILAYVEVMEKFIQNIKNY